MLIEKGICVVRGLVSFHDGCADALLTNFCREVQHKVKGTAAASLHDQQ